MELLGIPHVEYKVIWNDGVPYSICEDFITKDTELVPAWRIMQTSKKDNSTSNYRHFVNCCNELGAGDVTKDLDRMIVIDFIIANEDRHLNNFGLVRNADTLQWIGFAPIYDSGTSLGYDRTNAQLRFPGTGSIICNPFKKTHEEQLKLVSSFDWIDRSKLSGVEEIIKTIFLEKTPNDYIDEQRAETIALFVKNRINMLRAYVDAHSNDGQDMSVIGDVKHNIAEDYTSK